LGYCYKPLQVIYIMAKKTKTTDTPLPEEKPVKEKKTTKVKADKVEPEVVASAAKKAVKTKTAPVAETTAPKPKTVKTKVAEAVQATSPAILKAVEPYSRFTDFDISLFKSGKHFKLYEKFGSHVVEYQGVVGTYFSVWAPNAQYVSVIANFNGWNRGSHSLNARGIRRAFGRVLSRILA
jgi:1,4-alpha-glucan branching enzyme